MKEFFMGVDPYILIWLVMIVVFVVAELISVGLTSIWFAAGAVVALIIAIAGGGLPWQLGAFLVVSIVLLAATRPWAKKFINSRVQRTNLDSLVGGTVVITERVCNQEQTGAGTISGKEWTIRSVTNEETFEVGEEAIVKEISGVKLMVSKKEDVL